MELRRGESAVRGDNASVCLVWLRKKVEVVRGVGIFCYKS